MCVCVFIRRGHTCRNSVYTYLAKVLSCFNNTISSGFYYKSTTLSFILVCFYLKVHFFQLDKCVTFMWGHAFPKLIFRVACLQFDGGEGQLIETILKVCGFAIFCWTLLEYP